MRHRDGHWLWHESVGRVVEVDMAGLPVRMLGIVADIEDRRRAEETVLAAHRAVQQSETLLTEIIENSPSGLIVYDAQLERVRHNSNFCRLLDLPPERVGATPFRLADQVHDLHAPCDYGPGRTEREVFDHFAGLMQARQTIRMEWQQTDGAWIEFSGIPISGGRPS